MQTTPPPTFLTEPQTERAAELAEDVARRAAPEAAQLCVEASDADVARALEEGNPAQAVLVLAEMPEERRVRVLKAATPQWAQQWAINAEFAPDSIGRLMSPPFAEFPASMTVREAIERLREIVKTALISYAFVVDDARRLLGLLVFRDMLIADREATLAEVMLPDPFRLRATTPVADAMREMVNRHYPSYPICDERGRLVGSVRGQSLFQRQAFELSAQPGEMVGVQKEERIATPWLTSLKTRHPWLQLNLLTAFLAASVVGVFQGTIDRVVALAVFLPVVAGQSGNTGCQALAVTLRGMTLGELDSGRAGTLVAKEAWLGLLNGVLVGIVAALGMLYYAFTTGVAAPWALAAIVLLAMTGSCVASGVSGVLVPVLLKRLGADPATASSIFVTTATDCASMGLFLGLATLMMP
jgi:magnesium transporter